MKPIVISNGIWKAFWLVGKNKEGKGCPESQKKEKPPFKKKLSKKSFQNGRTGEGGSF